MLVSTLAGGDDDADPTARHATSCWRRSRHCSPAASGATRWCWSRARSSRPASAPSAPPCGRWGWSQTRASALPPRPQPGEMVQPRRQLASCSACWWRPSRPPGRSLFGLDETIERRWGPQIAAKGIYRDAVRSSKDHFVKASGLRWVCLMLLVPIPWAGRVWALPFLTRPGPLRALRPGARAAPQDADRLGAPDAAGWSGAGGPTGPSSWSPTAATPPSSSWPRCRAWRQPGHRRSPACASTPRCTSRPRPAAPGQSGRPRAEGRAPADAGGASPPTRPRAWTRGHRRRLVRRGAAHGGDRLGHGGLVPRRPAAGAAALGADPRSPRARSPPRPCSAPTRRSAPAQILAWFVLRWQLEVTFEEARRHLGVETQRQWSDLAILRTTPALLGLFSLVTLFAAPAHGAASRPRPAGGLVPQAAADLLRCAGPGPPRTVGAAGFLLSAARPRHGKSPPRVRGALDRDPLLRRLNGHRGPKSSSVVQFAIACGVRPRATWW